MLKNNPQFKDFFNRLDDICKSAAELLHASASSIYLKQDNQVIMHAAYGYSESLIHKAQYSLDEGITGWIASGNDFIANSRDDISSHPKHIGKYDNDIWKDGVHRCCSMVATPLLIGDVIYGLIKVENKSTDGACEPFSDIDLNRLKIFVAAISNFLQQNKELWSALGKYFVFVLMPFRKDFLNIYDCIKQASEKANMFCEKIDSEPTIGKISTKIYDMINRADIVVSVMTGRNPNVFYETGYSHAQQKSTILLAENTDEIPFDLKDYNHIIYSPSELPQLREDLFRYYDFVKANILIKNQITFRSR
jgi:hypothetical protein